MQDLLKSLYRVYCERKGQYDLPPEAEDASKVWSKACPKRISTCC